MEKHPLGGIRASSPTDAEPLSRGPTEQLEAQRPAGGQRGRRDSPRETASGRASVRCAAGNEGRQATIARKPKATARAPGPGRLAGGASTACTVTTGPATVQPPASGPRDRGVGGCLEGPHGHFSGPPARFCGLGGRVVSIPAVHRSDTGRTVLRPAQRDSYLQSHGAFARTSEAEAVRPLRVRSQ